MARFDVITSTETVVQEDQKNAITLELQEGKKNGNYEVVICELYFDTDTKTFKYSRSQVRFPFNLMTLKTLSNGINDIMGYVETNPKPMEKSEVKTFNVNEMNEEELTTLEKEIKERLKANKKTVKTEKVDTVTLDNTLTTTTRKIVAVK